MAIANVHYYVDRQRQRLGRLEEIRTDLQEVIKELHRRTRDDETPIDMRTITIAKNEIEEFCELLDLIVADRIEEEEKNDQRKR